MQPSTSDEQQECELILQIGDIGMVKIGHEEELLCLIYRIATSFCTCPEVTTKARQCDLPLAPQILSISLSKQTQVSCLEHVLLACRVKLKAPF